MKKLEDLKIAVFGDFMLDRYIFGKVDRISQEAPVPILTVTREDQYSLGGAGNVVKNLTAMDCQVHSFPIIGQDEEGETIIEELHNVNSFFQIYDIDDHISTVKTRLISMDHNTQVMRLDRERFLDDHDFHLELSDESLEIFDAIIISDYGKGSINKKLMNKLKNYSDVMFIDPKPENMHLYPGAFLIKPNDIEYHEIYNKNANDLKRFSWVLHTMGVEGMELISNKNSFTFDVKSDPVEVFNVSGAGDTVLAAFVLCYSMGYDPLAATRFANECGRWAVSQPGTSTLTMDVFDELFKKVIPKVEKSPTKKCSI